jgi:hypothetical protein
MTNENFQMGAFNSVFFFYSFFFFDIEVFVKLIKLQLKFCRIWTTRTQKFLNFFGQKMAKFHQSKNIASICL